RWKLQRQATAEINAIEQRQRTAAVVGLPNCLGASPPVGKPWIQVEARIHSVKEPRAVPSDDAKPWRHRAEGQDRGAEVHRPHELFLVRTFERRQVLPWRFLVCRASAPQSDLTSGDADGRRRRRLY